MLLPMSRSTPPASASSCCLHDGYEIFWATPDVAVGAMPCKPEHLALLKEQGLGAVLNLCAEFCDLPGIEREHGLAVRYLPIDDMGVPDPAQLDVALEWLELRLSEGRKVFIHCRFGMGRTGTVLACWLARRGLCLTQAPGCAPEDPTSRCDWRAKPVSVEQRRFVEAYLRRLGIAMPDRSLWRRVKACLFGR